MHPTAQRLLDAYEKRQGAWHTKAELARFFGVSQQTLDHWIKRGVSKAGLLEASDRLGVRAEWLRSGAGDETSPPQMGVAHVSILDKSTVEPLSLTWELLMQSSELPAEFAVRIPDDALGDRTPIGTLLYMRRADRLPPVGKGILVEDSNGQRYIRRMAQGPGGSWVAESKVDGYISLRSDADGLKLLAVAYGKRDESGDV